MEKFRIKTKIIIMVAMLICIAILPLFMGNSAIALAEESKESGIAPTNEISEENEETGEKSENAIEGLLEGFIEGLKKKYGDDYQTYYNAIIAEWGSVEAYLLSLVDDGTVPDVTADGWKAFINWLGEYSPIWGSIFAIVAIIIVILLGKKALNKISDFIKAIGAKYKVVTSSINKMYKTDIAQNQALLKLIGENERFKEEREALKNSIEEIKKDDEL